MAGAAQAQGGPVGSGQDNSGLNGSLSRADVEKLGGDAAKESAGRSAMDRSAAGTVREQAERLLGLLQIGCTVTDAKVVAAGTRRVGPRGKEVASSVHEVACTGDVGYLLETQGEDAPIGISCLRAEEMRARDVAAGKAPGYFCTLPGNKDVYAYLAWVIQLGRGAACSVKELLWFGWSESTHTDYSEVACREGGGYLVQAPLPGSPGQVAVMTCMEAAARGLKCRLTDAGASEAPLALDDFRAALARNGESCRVEQLRLVGQEEKRRRYVVEYRCAGQPASVVAFIPLQDNAAPYEAVGCTEATARGVNCSYSR
jgi:hypothetical protein